MFHISPGKKDKKEPWTKTYGVDQASNEHGLLRTI
jgi:hypothetical protein